jgi:hypothetical protein
MRAYSLQFGQPAIRLLVAKAQHDQTSNNRIFAIPAPYATSSAPLPSCFGMAKAWLREPRHSIPHWQAGASSTPTSRYSSSRVISTQSHSNAMRLDLVHPIDKHRIISTRSTCCHSASRRCCPHFLRRHDCLFQAGDAHFCTATSAIIRIPSCCNA